LKLDSSGNFNWAMGTGGTDDDWSNSIALDATGNIFTTGYFMGTADFNPDTGVFNLTSGGSRDIFISKFGSAGNFIWAKSLSGVTGYDYGCALATDPSGNVYSTGYFTGTIDFDPGASTFNLASAGAEDIFLLKLDSSSNFVWAKRAGGGATEIGKSIVIVDSSIIYIAGEYWSPTVTFDSITIVHDTSFASADLFISKIETPTLTAINNEQDNFEGSGLFYPNPANNKITLDLRKQNEMVLVTISDITGKIIYSASTISNKMFEINLDLVSDGVYIIKTQSADFLNTQKLIVRK